MAPHDSPVADADAAGAETEADTDAGPADRDTGDGFRPVTRVPLSLLVSRQIRDAIVAGDLPVGSELPSEGRLGERFGVSRSTIREALRIVQALGLLSGGDTVSTARPRVSVDHTVARASEAIENVLRLGRVPLGDLVELRLAIEGAALGRPAVETARLGEARAALAVMQRPDVDVATFHDADVRFHLSLAGVSGNGAFPLVMSAVRDAIAGHLLDALQALDDPRPTLERLAGEHDAILAAVESGDCERATRLVRDHVWAFYAEGVGDG
jgi:GntR family transcriptional repressor for pyruvate dehydrogenase complex